MDEHGDVFFIPTDLEIPEDFKKDMSVFMLVVFFAIPAMALLGFWYRTTPFGGLILAAIVGGVFISSILSPINEEYDFTAKALSIAVVFLSTWGPLAFSYGSGYFLYVMMYTSIAFSFGTFTILMWFNKWAEFWEGIKR